MKSKRMKSKTLLFSVVLLLAFLSPNLNAQDFQQQFTGGVVADYDDATANEFDAISTSGAPLPGV